MAKKNLVKVDSPMVGYIGSDWASYKIPPWGWRLVIRAGLGVVALYLISWVWTMLDQDEYGVAMLLTFFFLIIGIGGSPALPRRLIRMAGVFAVIAVTVFSTAKIWTKKGDKHWTAIRIGRSSTYSEGVSTPAPNSHPSPSLTTETLNIPEARPITEISCGPCLSSTPTPAKRRK